MDGRVKGQGPVVFFSSVFFSRMKKLLNDEYTQQASCSKKNKHLKLRFIRTYSRTTEEEEVEEEVINVKLHIIAVHIKFLPLDTDKIFNDLSIYSNQKFERKSVLLMWKSHWYSTYGGDYVRKCGLFVEL